MNTLKTAAAAALLSLVPAGAALADSQIQLAAAPSKCIHKKLQDWSNGNPLHLWDCRAGPSANKTFYWDPETGYIHFAENTSKCLHKKNSDWTNGNPLHMWDCSAGVAANKSWDYEASTGLIKARYNAAKCIHKKNNDTNNGNPLHLWDCSAGSSANKSWSMELDLDQVNTGSIDLGDLSLEYDPNDLYEDDDGSVYIDGDIDVVFGDYSITLYDAILEVELDGDHLNLVGGSVGNGFSSDIGPFGLLDDLLTATDITVGYGSGDVLDGIDAPIDTTQSYFFLSVSVGTIPLTSAITLGSTKYSGSMLLVVEPTAPTIYVNAEGIFPEIDGSPISIEEVGLGFSANDSLVWTPDVTWEVEDVMVEQRGNLWLDAVVDLELYEILKLRFDGELLADVDFQELIHGSGDLGESLDAVAGNLGTSFVLDLQLAEIELDLTDASALYDRAEQRVVVAGETADISGFGELGQALSTSSASVSMHIEDGDLRELNLAAAVTAPGGVEILDFEVAATESQARLSGTLDLGVTRLSASATVSDLDLQMSGSKTYTLNEGFAEIRLSYELDATGFDGSAQLKVYNFATGGWNTVNMTTSVASGYLKLCAGTTVCVRIDASGNAEEIFNNIESVYENVGDAVEAGWSLASGAVVDASGDVIEGLEDFGGDVSDFLDDAGDFIDDVGDGAKKVCNWLGIC